MDHQKIQHDIQKVIKHPLFKELSRTVINEGINFLTNLKRNLHDSHTNTIKQRDRTMSNFTPNKTLPNQ